MNKDLLAILVNQLDGYDEAENLLGVDAEIIARSIEGDTLTRSENAQLNKGFADAEINDSFSDYGLDIEQMEILADELTEANSYLADNSFKDELREAIANGDIDLDNFVENYGLFANLTLSHQEKIFEHLSNGGDFNAMLEAYGLDEDIWNVEDSAFWEWFRDTFYSD